MIPSNDVALSKKVPTHQDILDFQEFIGKFPQLGFDTRHHHSDGQYIREIRMVKDSYVIGKEHKTRHLNILTHGKVTVWTVHGRMDLCADNGPVIFESLPGVKKVLYMHTDCIWLTAHPTDEVDQDRLEFQFIKSAEQLSLFPELETLYLGGNKS